MLTNLFKFADYPNVFIENAVKYYRFMEASMKQLCFKLLIGLVLLTVPFGVYASTLAEPCCSITISYLEVPFLIGGPNNKNIPSAFIW
jgi:hypothetical protein